MRQIKILIEEHEDGFVGYPVGLKGVVVGQGDTYEEALADVKSAICFYAETVGHDVVDEATSMLKVYLVDAEVPI
jgi:predicted RNase H-like HicB family nuclease